MNSKTRRAVSGKVDFPRFYGIESKPLKASTKPIISGGFDIEADAQSADPYLICAHLTNGKSFKKDLHEAYDVLEFLCQPSFFDSINGFWNIGYDSEGMLRFFPNTVKYLLSKNPEVYLTQNLKLADKSNYFYHIRLIPKKALYVRSVVSRVNKFYDFAQYYNKERLDKVAKRLLGVGKDGGIDASKSSREQYFNDPVYRADMQKYCLIDATRTAQIGTHLIKSIHSFLPTRNFTSCASIAEQYVTRNGYYTPQAMKNLYRPFLKTYWGGRFELFKRGFIPDTHTSDLKSAYPWAMSIMPILTDNLTALRVTDQFSPDALYGAYRISITVPDSYLGPLPFESQGPIIYPLGQFESWVDKETLTYLNTHNFDYSILEGIELFDDNAEFRLSKAIYTLFAIKENDQEDPGLRMAAKIILNSIYGKMIQLVDDTEGFITDLETAIDQNLNVDCITEEGIFATKHTGIFKCGKMFNPPYASFTTAKTRIRLLEAAEQVKFSNLVAFQTDSVTTINEQIPIIKGLGGWDYKGRKDMASGKSGFYQFQDSGEIAMNPQWKIFNRIAETKARSYARIDDIAMSEYQVRRRVSLRESAHANNFTNLNLIHSIPLSNNINTDSKRIWDSPITYDDLRPGGRCVDSIAFSIPSTFQPKNSKPL